MSIISFTDVTNRNPLSSEVLTQLTQIIASADGPVIFTGSDRVFASGANLREIAELTPAFAPDFSRQGQAVMDQIACLNHLTVAAINGVCFGGALDLALACRHRVASPNASFAHPGTGLGIITGWGGTQRLPRLVGYANAVEMFFTAEPIDAPRALQIGLIEQIVDDPLGRALAIVGRTSCSAERPPLV